MSNITVIDTRYNTEKLFTDPSPNDSDVISWDESQDIYVPKPNSNITVYEAGEEIGQYKALALDDNGHTILFSHTSSSRFKYVGVSVESALAGEVKRVQIFGDLNNPAWSFVPSGHRFVYANVNGDIVQASPVNAGELVQQIGIVLNSDTIHIAKAARLIL